jgi:hypothetical protein
MADLPFCALVELITVIEERFGFEMDREDITAEAFESVGWLSTYVSSTAASKARATFRNSEGTLPPTARSVARPLPGPPSRCPAAGRVSERHQLVRHGGSKHGGQGRRRPSSRLVRRRGRNDVNGTLLGFGDCLADLTAAVHARRGSTTWSPSPDAPTPALIAEHLSA